MIKFVRITDKNRILHELQNFSHIFPHLYEKIDNIDAYAEKLSKNANFYLGIENEEPFGLSVFYSNDKTNKTAYISLIGIKATERNKGLGGWLLSRSEDKAKEDGMTQISLEVDCDNSSAISFYEGKGYTISTKSQRNSLYMNKQLG